MRKLNLIFIFVMALEIIVMLAGYYSLADKCENGCNSHSFLNPFGLGGAKACFLVCAYVPHPLFYIFTDLLIITIIIYLVYLIRGNKK